MTDQVMNLGGMVVSSEGETSSTAVAAREQARVLARYAMADKRPRDFDDARQDVLADCKRWRFAEKARFSRPIGTSNVEGWTIRFAEGVLRAWGNVAVDVSTSHDDEEKRIVSVSVTDLESNLSRSQDLTIEKTVERSSVKEGAQLLGQRVNSKGGKVYIVRATEDDLLNKVNAQVSKAVRTLGLSLIPADLLEEALDQIHATLTQRDTEDPDAARKRCADAFAELGVRPSDLKAYMNGTELAAMSPAQLGELRTLYVAVREGETTWADALKARQETEARPAERSASTVDPKDLEVMNRTASVKAGALGDSRLAASILVSVSRTFDVKAPSALPKSDLPAFLKAVSAWEPPADEAAAAAAAKPVEGEATKVEPKPADVG